MRKQTWNDRFNVTFSKDNRYLHEYYREYFAKPANKRLVSITSPRNHERKRSLPIELPRIEVKIGQKQVKRREKDWDARFFVAESKDNQWMHWTFREYFDSLSVRRPEKYTRLRVSR